ncbi:hypothetical protein BIW11_11510 [Tropilaelaps mercedesae]|uniref:Uncharacterized protein n=1 Tax=Tropilaelaps mercedesae TaxID=418985 RepID=A0A1V9XB17_9ACAR|nr:hypothetical protein BIW11_11510 [Tropilaelaps mercedesae]
MDNRAAVPSSVKERPRPIVDDANQTVFLPDEGKDRPACRVHVIPGTNLALKRLMEVTDKDFTKALLAPVLMSCRGCSKSFPGVARLTEMLMHLDSKLHSKTCGVPAEENPLYQIALETTAAKKRAAEEEALMHAV